MLCLSISNNLLRRHICMLKCHHPCSEWGPGLQFHPVWREGYGRLNWLCKAALRYPLLCSLPLLAPWHWSNFCQVIYEWKTYFKRWQIQLVGEEGKAFFCQVHMVTQLKGSVNQPGPAWPRKKEHTIRDRATRICVFHLCLKLYHLRPAAGLQSKSSPESGK